MTKDMEKLFDLLIGWSTQAATLYEVTAGECGAAVFDQLNSQLKELKTALEECKAFNVEH